VGGQNEKLIFKVCFGGAVKGLYLPQNQGVIYQLWRSCKDFCFCHAEHNTLVQFRDESNYRKLHR